MKFYIFIMMLLLLVSVANAEVWITTPSPGDRLMDVNTTLVVMENDSSTNCTYTINDFVPETCVFNTTNNITAFFGWNKLEVCGTNTTGNQTCDSINFWSDKTDKDVADYFLFFLLLGMGVLFGVAGFTMLGVAGVLGGILIILAGVESISFGVNTISYALILLGVMFMIGGFMKK